MKAISKSALVLLCFAVLPSLSASASPSGNESRDAARQEITMKNLWWFQATWMLPPQMGDNLFDWLDKTFTNGIDWYADRADSVSEKDEANPFGIIINKGVMSGNPG
jgi:hypothetical protein